MVSPLELFTWSKVLALGSDALEVICVVLEAVRGVRCALGCCGLHVPMLGLVRLGEPGYDGIGQGAGAGRFRKSLTIETSGLEGVFAEENRKVKRGKREKSGKDLRGEVRVGHCRSVFAVEDQVGLDRSTTSLSRSPPWTPSRLRSRRSGRQSKTMSRVPRSICAGVISNVSRPSRSRRHAKKARNLRFPM